ncbi:hypothetical protein Tco_0419900 [Tanacetum coccineum]
MSTLGLIRGLVLNVVLKDCPKLKNNNNRGNQAGNAKAQAKVYAMGNVGANPDNNCNTPKMGRSGIRIRGMLLQDQ